jgi:hypothetical protein
METSQKKEGCEVSCVLPLSSAPVMIRLAYSMDTDVREKKRPSGVMRAAATGSTAIRSDELVRLGEKDWWW